MGTPTIRTAAEKMRKERDERKYTKMPSSTSSSQLTLSVPGSQQLNKKRVVVEKGAPGWPKMVKNRSPIQKKSALASEVSEQKFDSKESEVTETKPPEEYRRDVIPESETPVPSLSLSAQEASHPVPLTTMKTEKKSVPVVQMLKKTQWAAKVNVVKQCTKCQMLFSSFHECGVNS